MKISHILRVLAIPACALLLAACTNFDFGKFSRKSAPASSGIGSDIASDIGIGNVHPTDYSVGSGSPEKLAALAVSHHPRIKAMHHKADRMAATAPQVGSLPDPNASIAIGSLPETAAGQVEAVIGVSQKIPLPGKRDSASRAARLEAEAIRAEADALSLRIGEQVKNAWWDYYLAEETISFTQENRTLLTSIRDVVAARLETEAAAQADQLRIENEISLLDRDLANLEQLRSSAKSRINSLLNRPTGSSLPHPSAPSIITTSSLEALVARAESNHPEIRAAQSRIDAFEQRLRKAKLEKYPDPTIGLTYAPVTRSGIASSANGRDQVFTTLGFNIPLWQKPRRAMVREASAGISETQALLASSRSELRYRVEDAYFRAKTAREVTSLFSGKLIPSAKQAQKVTLAGYSAGKNSFTDLIDTQRELLTYRLQLVKSRAQLGKAIATLQSAAAL